MSLLKLLFPLLLAGCASTGEPYCVIYEEGQVVKILFQGSKQQMEIFRQGRMWE